MNKKTERPNILLLFTDQQRFDTICAAGYSHMKTPNLDRLVHEGCLFTNAYTPNPICVPARHNLITGLPARYHGFSENNTHPNPADLPTLPRILSDNGYVTRAVGKMHFRPVRRHNGFDRMELMEEIPNFREDDDYAMYLKEVGLGHILNIHGVRNLLYMAPQQSLIPEKHHGSTWVADRSCAFLQAERGRRPFFLWSSWIHPHPPFDVPNTFSSLYTGEDLPEPLQSETDHWEELRESRRHAGFPESAENKYVRRMRELYYSSISLVDKNIGRVLDTLDKIGQADNTIVIFASDHGEMLGDHGAYQKMLPYDSCARIPFIVRYPRHFKPGSVCNDFVDLNDILPSVLDVCGLEYSGSVCDSLPGRSIFNSAAKREVQYMEYGSGSHRWIAMIDQHYKYVYHYGGARELLFDRKCDPGETVNLLAARPADPAICNIKDHLRRLLCEHEEHWGLEGYADSGKFRLFDEPVHLDANQPLPVNAQFPVFQENIMDAREKKSMDRFTDELLDAVAPEQKTVKLKEMQLDAWCARGGSPDLVEKIRQAGS